MLEVDEGEALMVSSSLIRRLLAEGKVRRAALCLGRPYALVGTVVGGARRGRKMGFPTVNILIQDQLIPGEGVYAGRAVVGNDIYMSAISIGHNPTFGGAEQQVEAYLLEFDGDLYGRSIRIEVARRLRDQRTFDSPEALIEQIRHDVQAVRRDMDSLRYSTPGGEGCVP
jgi:riboflavin kinase/FMN adenylyltransferase